MYDCARRLMSAVRSAEEQPDQVQHRPSFSLIVFAMLVRGTMLSDTASRINFELKCESHLLWIRLIARLWCSCNRSLSSHPLDESEPFTVYQLKTTFLVASVKLYHKSRA